MLGKLMKYEMKSTSRIILPIYLILFTLSVIGRFSIGNLVKNPMQENSIYGVFFGLLITAYVFLVFSAFIVTLVVIIQRFYKNMTGSEGYLMHTLPVNTHLLLSSKLFSAFIWMISTTVMVFLSLGMLLIQPETWSELLSIFSEFNRIMQEIFAITGVSALLTMALFVLMIIVSSFTSILLIYAAISIGHTFKKHRILGSVLSYIGLTMVAQAVVGILFSIIGTTMPSFFELDTIAQGISFGNTMITIVVLLDACLGAVWYFVSYYILTNQLNLE